MIFRTQVIANVDMHAIPLNVVCARMRLDRSADVFDSALPTQTYYRHSNTGSSTMVTIAEIETYFNSQLNRGASFVKISASLDMDQIGSVVEIGCGGGGVLYPFHLAGKKASGFRL